MNMIASHTLSLSLAVVAAGLFAAAPKMTPAEIAAKRAARIAAEGGFVSRPIKGKVLRIRVETDKITVAEVEAEAKLMRSLLRVAIEVQGKGAAESKNDVGGMILLAEQGEKAPSLLCAPEDYWANVNVTKLMAGEPDAATLKSRIVKELWRALGYTFGAAHPQQFTCVMRPISRPGELDFEKIATLSPMPVMGVKATLKALDFAAGGETTYRRACEEGWAAQPTNDVQKAIWEKVHQIPTKPLKIEFDPKTDKK